MRQVPGPRVVARLLRGGALAVAILVGVVGLAVGGAGRAAAQEGPTVEVEPLGAEPGEFILVMGSGFPVGETVTVFFGETPILTTTIEESGAFEVPAAVPLTVEPGPFLISVTGSLGSEFVLTYQVAAPVLTPTPTATGLSFEVLPEAALPGETITVTGGGFEGGEAVTVSFDGVELATVGATLSGAWLANVVVPVTTKPGPHTITVRGARGVELSLEYTVEAPAAPSVTPSPVATAEPTAVVTATPSGGEVTATPGTGDGTPAVPGDGGDGAGDGASDGGAVEGTRGTWDDLPVVFLGVMAVVAGVLAWGFWRWARREPPGQGPEQVARFDDADPPIEGAASPRS